MAVYTQLDERDLLEIVEDYGLVKVAAVKGIPSGSVNTNWPRAPRSVWARSVPTNAGLRRLAATPC